MTATTELLALLREAADYVEHSATCEFSPRLLRLTFAELADTPTVDRACTCGMRLLMVRVEDALANHSEAPKSSTPHLVDLLEARHETIHVEQPAHRTTPIGGDDDGS